MREGWGVGSILVTAYLSGYNLTIQNFSKVINAKRFYRNHDAYIKWARRGEGGGEYYSVSCISIRYFSDNNRRYRTILWVLCYYARKSYRII